MVASSAQMGLALHTHTSRTAQVVLRMADSTTVHVTANTYASCHQHAHTHTHTLDCAGLQSKQVLNRASSGALTSPHSPGRLPTSPNRKPDSARLALQPSMLYMTHGQVKTGKAEAKRLARRRSSRIAGHTVYNVNTLTGGS